MVIQGADTDRLRAIEDQLTSLLGRVTDLSSRGHRFSSGLRQAWYGSDSESFVGGWLSNDLPSIATLQSSLEEVRETIRRNRVAQEVTSNQLDGGWVSIQPPGSTLPWAVPPDWVLPPPIWRDGDDMRWGDLNLIWPGDIWIMPDRFDWSNPLGLPDGWKIDADGLHGSGGGERGWLSERGVEGTYENGILSATGEASVSAAAQADWAASGSIGPDGIVAHAEAGIAAEVSASASGAASLGIMTASGALSASAGASARVAGDLSIGPDGAKGSAKGEAYAGARFTADAEVSAGGVTAGGEAEAWIGVGVSGEASFEASLDEISVDLELGAALGIGGSLSVSIEVSPSEVADSLVSGAEDAWNKYKPW